VDAAETAACSMPWDSTIGATVGFDVRVVLAAPKSYEVGDGLPA